MYKLILSLSLLFVVACTPAPQEYDEYYGAGFAYVGETQWPFEHATPYPFTVPNGEISCSSNPVFGPEIYFEPKGFTDESYIGTPLNKAAYDSLERANMQSNVPYSIKKDADLSTAIEIGLRVCNEQTNTLDNS